MNHLHEQNTPHEDQQRNQDDPHETNGLQKIIHQKIESGFYDLPETKLELARKLLLNWRESE